MKLSIGTKIKSIPSKFKKINKNILLKIITLILLPILIYLYTQLLGGGKLIFEWRRMLLNFIFIYLIIAIFYCISGKIKVSLAITTILTFIVGIVDYFITAFRGTPLVPWDIFSLNVALTVLPTFEFSFSKQLAIAIILFLVGIVFLYFIPIHSFKNGKIKKIYRLVAFLGSLTFIVLFLTTNLVSIFDLNENWDPKEEYHNNGLIASLFKQSRNLIITTPDDYDINKVKEIANEIEVELVENDDDYEQPNIIVIMNESFADLSVISDFKTNEDYMPNFRSIRESENVVSGNLHMSIFGATTPNSEWEVLTSNSMAFLPKRSVPYQQYVLRNSYSLASILKEQGYTTSAIHCYYPQGYNRNIVYPRLGFDSFLYMDTLSDLEFIRSYPNDWSTYRNIISLFEKKGEGEKIFNFTLTMQNHGSYTDENFEATIIAEDGQYPKLNQYLSLIQISDVAFSYLLDYFDDYPEPVVIVMFGDHQPYVEDEFYEELLSKEFEDTSSKEAVERKYITPFIIWANYDIDSSKYENITDISANYLSSLILDVAGVQKTAYLSFLDELREEIPVITGNGYMDKNGTYHDFSEENEYTELINEYHYLQFNNMFDNKNKITSLFEVPKAEENMLTSSEYENTTNETSENSVENSDNEVSENITVENISE